MENRTLKQQFEGLGNLYITQESPSRVLFRINGLKCKKPLEKTYNNVKLTNNYEFYLAPEMREKYNNFFGEEHALYFEAIVYADELNVAESMAIDSITKELPRFETFFGVRLSADYSELIRENNGNFQIKISYAYKWINEGDEEQEALEADMNELGLPACKEFLHLDTLYASMNATAIPALKLNLGWQYIEAAFLDQGLGGEEIIKRTSEIIAHYMVRRIPVSLQVDLINVIWANADIGIKTKEGFLGYNDLRKIVDEVELDTTWLVDNCDKFNSPYISHHLNKYKNRGISELLEALKLHYKLLLREVYEQRNYIQHSGISHPLALKKLSYIFPSITEVFRYAISEEILKNKVTSLIEILETLRQPNAEISRLITADALFTEL